MVTGAFWSQAPDELLEALGTSRAGLSEAEARSRLERWGPNRPKPQPRGAGFRLFLRQFASPMAALLLVTAVLSGLLGEAIDATIILVILAGSGFLGFVQEWRADSVVEELLALIRTRTRVRRAGIESEIAIEDVVPGDVLCLAAGDMVPADCRLLESRDLDIEEAALTGESFPVSKAMPSVPADAPMAERTSALFQGTHVVSGTATALVIATGDRTIFGGLAGELERRRPESEFERGIRRFGYFLLEVTALLVIVVFAINVAFDRPVLDVLLFSLALAVGLTPQLLPAIVSITLAHGARRMAERQVVVRRLVAIENFGGMEVLCTDKTGTLTEGRVRVHAAMDAMGRPSTDVLRLAFLNASLQSGFENPIDTAIRSEPGLDTVGVRKIDEVPYDFSRRRLSVLIDESDGRRVLVTKGAFREVLEACSTAAGGEWTDAVAWRVEAARRVDELSGQGLRCLGIASRVLAGAPSASPADEHDMTFVGIVAFADPPKADAAAALETLHALGIRVKMITGDHHAVAASVAGSVRLSTRRVLTGMQMDRLTERALRRRARITDVFAEVDPNQKERIILALKEGGASVGYLGDGINDAAALHAADVGISVDTAVDATRRAADIVLLRKDLGVLAEGVAEGRRAFANTLKYVFVTTSANFGNMFSMAGASLFAAFLPMLPKQILLLNLLSDLPALAIATDRLDPELVARPRRWNVGFIRDFMITFGLVSSFFDFMTFGLLILLALPAAAFRTAWFIESVLTEIFVLLVIRTGRVFFRSAPSGPLVLASLGAAAVTIALPYVPGSDVLGFARLPPQLLLGLLLITALLVVASEATKRVFFGRHPLGGEGPPTDTSDAKAGRRRSRPGSRAGS